MLSVLEVGSVEGEKRCAKSRHNRSVGLLSAAVSLRLCTNSARRVVYYLVCAHQLHSPCRPDATHARSIKGLNDITSFRLKFLLSECAARAKLRNCRLLQKHLRIQGVLLSNSSKPSKIKPVNIFFNLLKFCNKFDSIQLE